MSEGHRSVGAFARTRISALTLGLSLVLGGSACSAGPEGSESEPRALDTRLEAHPVTAGKPSPEGLAYIQAVAEAHRVADGIADRKARIAPLLAALDQPPPPGDGRAERLHYELLARTAELLLDSGEAERALALVEPRLETDVSLPIDRASARCLVALGDAANQTGDHALAMSSYARSLEMLSLLLEEAEP